MDWQMTKMLLFQGLDKPYMGVYHTYTTVYHPM